MYVWLLMWSYLIGFSFALFSNGLCPIITFKITSDVYSFSKIR